MFSTPLFTDFFKVSHPMTLLALALLVGSFVILYQFEKKKISFSMRMLIGLGLGLLLGVGLQAIAGFPSPELIKNTTWIQQSITWFSFTGSVFVGFIRMLVVPIIMSSLIYTIINFKSSISLASLTRRSIFWLMITTGVAVAIGIVLALGTRLGSNIATISSTASARNVIDLSGIILGIIPSNPILAMSRDNVIAVVIFAAMIATSARIMGSKEKYAPAIGVFAQFVDASYRIVMSMAMTIIKYMPYAVVSLLASTLMSHGLQAIQSALLFIGLVYLASFIMIAVYAVILLLHGLNPITFYRKALPALTMAFSSRSSVGTLPVTISTLKDRLGVSGGTANLVSSLGSTMGMNGCAGYFPGLVAIMVATMTGTPIDASFIIMVIIVGMLGSLGIAGIPGSATMAASIMLAGIGLNQHFHLLAVVLAIDPLIDMGRTMINVNGAMISALAVDKEFGTLNVEAYNSKDADVSADVSDFTAL
ncbi:MAG: cation:dicarboxylate symporter family transporter [Brevinema sp.]